MREKGEKAKESRVEATNRLILGKFYSTLLLLLLPPQSKRTIKSFCACSLKQKKKRAKVLQSSHKYLNKLSKIDLNDEWGDTYYNDRFLWGNVAFTNVMLVRIYPIANGKILVHSCFTHIAKIHWEHHSFSFSFCFYFYRKFQLMMSNSDNKFLSSNQDTLYAINTVHCKPFVVSH